MKHCQQLILRCVEGFVICLFSNLGHILAHMSFRLEYHVIKCSSCGSYPLWFCWVVVTTAPTHSVLLYWMWDLKATQMNWWRHLIWKLMFCVFELGHNAREQPRQLISVRKLDGPWKCTWSSIIRSRKPKTLHSKAILQGIEAIQTSSYRRVSVELFISRPIEVHHLKFNQKHSDLLNCASCYQHMVNFPTNQIIINFDNYFLPSF